MRHDPTKWIWIAGAVYCLFVYIFLFRNITVHKFRIQLIDIAFGDFRDIEGMLWMKAEFQSVSFERMIWMFWKPVQSFYRGTMLLERWQKTKEE